MRRSIATVSLSGMLREKLEAIAAARFDGVEIFENDLLTFGERRGSDEDAAVAAQPAAKNAQRHAGRLGVLQVLDDLDRDERLEPAAAVGPLAAHGCHPAVQDRRGLARQVVERGGQQDRSGE